MAVENYLPSPTSHPAAGLFASPAREVTMADLQVPPRVVRVTEDTTLDELAETIGLLNTEAKAMSRRGKTGQLTVEYARWHQLIDSVLSDYLDAVSRFSQTATDSSNEQHG